MGLPEELKHLVFIEHSYVEENIIANTPITRKESKTYLKRHLDYLLFTISSSEVLMENFCENCNRGEGEFSRKFVNVERTLKKDSCSRRVAEESLLTASYSISGTETQCILDAVSMVQMLKIRGLSKEKSINLMIYFLTSLEKYLESYPGIFAFYAEQSIKMIAGSVIREIEVKNNCRRSWTLGFLLAMMERII